MSARIDENGAKTEKLWLKQGSRGLFAKKQSFQGLDLKKPGTKTKLNLNYRGWHAKLQAKDGGFYFRKVQGLKQKRKDCLVNSFQLDRIAG